MKSPHVLSALLCGLILLEIAAYGAVTSKPFGETPQGKEVTLYTISNSKGMSVSVMNYGATVVNLIVPDRTGKAGDVVLGFSEVTPYFTQTAYLGATAGRYANRIAKGRFKLNDTLYRLPLNNGPNTLHGGFRGFDKRMWKVTSAAPDSNEVCFTRLSPDGEEGYPGNLQASVTFKVNPNNELQISYTAITDKPTVLNLTNHTYFNLADAGNGSILHHLLKLNADAFTPVDATLIPTGEIKNVAGTAWDFRASTPIGLHLKETGGSPIGYDHNYVLNKGLFSDRSLAAVVEEPRSGRVMKVYTDQPGIQFYTGNFLDGTLTGKGGKVYRQYGGFCLETQHFPDSPNEKDFPSTILLPGETYRTTTTYAFITK